MQYTAIFHGFKNDNFQMKNCDIFLIFAQNIDRGYTETVLTSTHYLKIQKIQNLIRIQSKTNRIIAETCNNVMFIKHILIYKYMTQNIMLTNQCNLYSLRSQPL